MFTIYSVIPGRSLDEALVFLGKIGDVCSVERSSHPPEWGSTDPYLEFAVYAENGSAEEEFGIQDERCSVLIRKDSQRVQRVSGDKLFRDGSEVLELGTSSADALRALGLTKDIAPVGRDFIGGHLSQDEVSFDFVVVFDDQKVTSITLGFETFSTPDEVQAYLASERKKSKEG